MATLADNQMLRTLSRAKLDKFDSLSDEEQKLILTKIYRYQQSILTVLAAYPTPAKLVQRGFGMGPLVDALIIIDQGKPKSIQLGTWSGYMKVAEQYATILRSLSEGKRPADLEQWKPFGADQQKLAKIQGIVVAWILNADLRINWMQNLMARLDALESGVTGITLSMGDAVILEDFKAFFSSVEGINLITDAGRLVGGTYGRPGWNAIPYKAIAYAIPRMRIPSGTTDLNATSTILISSAHLNNYFKPGSTSKYAYAKRVLEKKKGLDSWGFYRQKYARITGIQVREAATIAASQQASAAGITSLPTLPFYQKPAFTLAMAGGILAIGYTIIGKR